MNQCHPEGEQYLTKTKYINTQTFLSEKHSSRASIRGTTRYGQSKLSSFWGWQNECQLAGIGILCRSGDPSRIVSNSQGDCLSSTNALQRVWSQSPLLHLLAGYGLNNGATNTSLWKMRGTSRVLKSQSLCGRKGHVHKFTCQLELDLWERNIFISIWSLPKDFKRSDSSSSIFITIPPLCHRSPSRRSPCAMPACTDHTAATTTSCLP